MVQYVSINTLLNLFVKGIVYFIIINVYNINGEMLV